MADEGKPLLAKLREPFPANQISKLPKETKTQADQRKNDRNSAMKCEICGGWHHKHAVHLDYVGHAALTDRLLDTDIEWTWEPLSYTPEGLPLFSRENGLWIKLTVQGVTRLGFGSADGKSGGDAVKEIIGDALRNAAMRFGAALDLWHKGDLHADDTPEAVDQPPAETHDRRRPAARQKLEGEHTSATALGKVVRELRNTVNAATNEAQIDAALRFGKGTIREAEKEWPDLLAGDPNVPEDGGLKGDVAARRKLLQNSMATALAESAAECADVKALGTWYVEHSDRIEALSDIDRDIFDKEHAALEAKLETQEAA